MEISKDFWRCGVVRCDMASIIRRGSLDDLPITWIPGTAGLRYLADPFALWRDEKLHIFAEDFSYRDGIGRINVTVMDRNLAIIEQRLVLRENWHLSYPFVWFTGDDAWLMPEANEGGLLRVYRATDFPFGWEPAHDIVLDCVPIDASLLHHNYLWWLFYAPAGPAGDRLTKLHAAWAPRLAGPWHPHPGNPVLVDPDGVRPGGSPIVVDGLPYLPLQRCTESYGSGLRILRIDHLAPARFRGTITAEISAPPAASPYVDGCHTLSAAGPVTLIDVKQTRFSLAAIGAWPERTFRRRLRHR